MFIYSFGSLGTCCFLHCRVLIHIRVLMLVYPCSFCLYWCLSTSFNQLQFMVIEKVVFKDLMYVNLLCILHVCCCITVHYWMSSWVWDWINHHLQGLVCVFNPQVLWALHRECPLIMWRRWMLVFIYHPSHTLRIWAQYMNNNHKTVVTPWDNNVQASQVDPVRILLVRHIINYMYMSKTILHLHFWWDFKMENTDC